MNTCSESRDHVRKSMRRTVPLMVRLPILAITIVGSWWLFVAIQHKYVLWVASALCLYISLRYDRVPHKHVFVRDMIVSCTSLFMYITIVMTALFFRKRVSPTNRVEALFWDAFPIVFIALVFIASYMCTTIRKRRHRR